MGQNVDSSGENKVIRVVVNWELRSLKPVRSRMNNEDPMSKVYQIPVRHVLYKWLVQVWTAAV